MDYGQKFSIGVEVARRQLQIAQHRQNLYLICLGMGMYDQTAQRVADGTFFGCNTNYQAYGFDLTDEECQVINAEYDAISRLEQQIFHIQTTGTF